MLNRVVNPGFLSFKSILSLTILFSALSLFGNGIDLIVCQDGSEELISIEFEPNLSEVNLDSDIENSNGYMTTKFYDIVPCEYTSHLDLGLILGAFPVTWKVFNGEQRTGHNWLQWDLTFELNVSHYEVERAINATSDFDPIGRVISQKKSTSLSNYNFEDYDILQAGIYYYRVKKIDINGDYLYSKVITLDTRLVRFSPASARIYPNPSIGQFTIELDVFEDQADVNYMIYNSYGAVAVTKNLLAQSVGFGNHTFLLDEAQLTPGVYTIHINIGLTVLQKKLLIVSN